MYLVDSPDPEYTVCHKCKDEIAYIPYVDNIDEKNPICSDCLIDLDVDRLVDAILER